MPVLGLLNVLQGCQISHECFLQDLNSLLQACLQVAFAACLDEGLQGAGAGSRIIQACQIVCQDPSILYTQQARRLPDESVTLFKSHKSLTAGAILPGTKFLPILISAGRRT